MDSNQAQEVAERDQLWASLRVLRAEIDRIAAGDFNSEAQHQVAMLLARIVASELDFRDRTSATADAPDTP